MQGGCLQKAAGSRETLRLFGAEHPVLHLSLEAEAAQLCWQQTGILCSPKYD